MTADGYSPQPPRTPRGAWRAPVARGPLAATVTVPGSKSLTNRELILASLADAPSRLSGPLHSDDSKRMIEAGFDGFETKPIHVKDLLATIEKLLARAKVS